MKFAEHLAAHITPEWRKQYISYEELKGTIYSAVEEMPSAEFADPEEVQRHTAQFDDYFFRLCDGELKKINNFFAEKLAEAIRKFSGLKRELEFVEKPLGRRSTKMGSAALNNRAQLPPRKMQDLKLAFTEFYLSLILLQNYQNLNFTGFRKILKKHDKLLKEGNGAEWRKEHVETSPFYTNKDIERLIAETEQTFTVYLEGGDRQKAMKRLRVPPLGDKIDPWLTFKVGFFLGVFLVLIAAALLGAIWYSNPDRVKMAVRLYRGPFLLLFFLTLMAGNVFVWRSSGVNHVLIFELDPRNHLSEQHLIELAAALGVAWTTSILCFLFSNSMSIPAYISPLILLILVAAFVFNPTRTLRYGARFWLLRVMGRILMAPFFHVGFADFWLADQMNSMVTVLTDYHYVVCFYMNENWLQAGEKSQYSTEGEFSRIVVNCLPAWFRFAQCLRRYRDSREAFPHLANAGKYGSSLIAAICLSAYNASKDEYSSSADKNPYLYLYILSAVVSTLYAYSWDIKMDWGLLDTYKPDCKFLREEMVYSRTCVYYFAILEDLLLRFMWIPVFCIMEKKLVPPDLVVSIAAVLEVFRRFIWNFFRLENEHLNNCGKFRAVRDISVAPIDASDPSIIVRMMDEEDGVINRKKRKRVNSKKMSKEDKKPLLFVKDQEETDSGSPPPFYI